MATFEFTDGRTLPIQFRLMLDSASAPLDGKTVELILRDRNGVLIDTGGDVTVVTPADGLVSYAPDRGDIAAARSPYKARFKATDALGQVVHFPEGKLPDIWEVGAV